MIEVVVYLGCFILLCLAIFQIALIAGAPIGKLAWGGQHTILPLKLRVGSVVSIAIYAFFAAILLAKAGIVPLIGSETFVDVTAWIIVAYLFIGIFMNAISRSKPERFVMTPTALVLAILFLIVALS